MSNIRLVSNTLHDDHAIRFLLAEKNQKYSIHSPESPEIRVLANWIEQHTNFPVLIDDDICLFNQTVILEYLDERYPLPPLMPIDPGTKARTRLIIKQLIQTWDKAKTDDLEIHKQLNTLNVYLSDQRYILGDAFSLADIVIMPILHGLRPEFRETITKLHNLNAYAQRIATRKSFKSSLLSYPRTDHILANLA